MTISRGCGIVPPRSRLLVRDHEAQFERVCRLLRREVAAGENVFVSLLVLLETEWVLRSRYQLTKPQIMAAISRLLDATEIRFEDEAAIEETLSFCKDSSAEFSDCLIGARNRRLGCRATATFDTKAVALPSFVAV